MSTPVVTSIASDLRTALAGITGMQKVWKVAGFEPSIISRVAGDDFPVALLYIATRQRQAQSKGANRPVQSTLQVRVLVLDNGRDEADDEWGAERAEELEDLVAKAVLADPRRGGSARDTEWVATAYNPVDPAQVDASVGVQFEVKMTTRFADLTTSGP